MLDKKLVIFRCCCGSESILVSKKMNTTHEIQKNSLNQLTFINAFQLKTH
jgi:hypothetical protein